MTANAEPDVAAASQLESFSTGTLDVNDIACFPSTIVLGLFATSRAVEPHRWRRRR
jgi:hypothetical protein